MTDSERERLAKRLRSMAAGIKPRNDAAVYDKVDLERAAALLGEPEREPDHMADLHPRIHRCFCGAVLGPDHRYEVSGERHYCPMNRPENLRVHPPSTASELCNRFCDPASAPAFYCQLPQGHDEPHSRNRPSASASEPSTRLQERLAQARRSIARYDPIDGDDPQSDLYHYWRGVEVGLRERIAARNASEGDTASEAAFIEEVAHGPYNDSDIESLYWSHVAKARSLLAARQPTSTPKNESGDT